VRLSSAILLTRLCHALTTFGRLWRSRGVLVRFGLRVRAGKFDRTAFHQAPDESIIGCDYDVASMSYEKALQIAVVDPAVNLRRGDLASPREFANWLGSCVIHSDAVTWTRKDGPTIYTAIFERVSEIFREQNFRGIWTIRLHDATVA
jgi:hypothetical protein